MAGKAALAVMLKVPVSGRVKTRLVPPLTHDEAAGLYRCFLKDTFDKVIKLPAIDLYAAYDGERVSIAEIVPAGIALIEQRGVDLGERMRNVMGDLLLKGHGMVSIIGSDSPDLPLDYILRSFELLNKKEVRVVLAPSVDGGYYLIGMREPLGIPFESIAWSDSKVLENTLIRLKDNNIAYSLLSPWHDIDTAPDLEYLRDNPGSPRSSAFLARIGAFSRQK